MRRLYGERISILSGRVDTVNICIYEALTDDAWEIRKKVFIDEQGFHDEFDGTDAVSVHFVVFDGRLPVATCRVFFDKEKQAYTLGRLAVIREYRGKNIGSAMIREAEKYIRSKGGTELVLHAQCRASGFYGKLGFAEFGSVENDEGCPHIWMRKCF